MFVSLSKYLLGRIIEMQRPPNLDINTTSKITIFCVNDDDHLFVNRMSGSTGIWKRKI